MRRREFIAGLGGVAASPLVARAQEANRLTRIGVLPFGSPSSTSDLMLVDAFREGLRDAGLIEGLHVVLDVIWVADESQYPQALIDLIRRGAKILVTVGSSASIAAKSRTSTIPIIFINVGNPLGIGLVESLSRPGGNVTGFSDMIWDLSGKYIELARELGNPEAPIDYLWYSAWPDGRNRLQATERAAQAVGVPLRSRPLSELGELEGQIAAMKSDRATSVIIQPSPFMHRHRARVIESATNSGLPTIYGFPPVGRDGVLIAYGPDPIAMYRGPGSYVARVLRGEKPGDLPVQQPTEFELVINLKTARALSLTVPPSLLARADEVIE
jgi:putative tryptophan/tyrosine transport system substrate-binding protein